jgi:thiol-disulfide isomerase/thioredoxin
MRQRYVPRRPASAFTLVLAALFAAATAGAADPSAEKAGAEKVTGEKPTAPADAAVGTLEEQIQTLGKAYRDREASFYQELVANKRDSQKVSAANRSFNEDARKYYEAMIKLLKEHGSEPAAIDGIVILLTDMRYPLDDQLVAITLDHHLSDAKLGQVCQAISHRGSEDWPLKILGPVATRHPLDAVRGQALLSLGDYYRSVISPWGPKQTEDEKERSLDKARGYYDRVVKDFAKLPSADGKATLGEKATWELTRLDNRPNLKVGQPAPPITGDDLDGRTMQLADFRGKVTVLVFWGTWCGDCMAMVPHEKKLVERYRDQPFALIGVNCGDPRDVAQAAVKKREMNWPQWWDRGGTRESPIQIAYDIQLWPTIFVIDRAGVIRFIATDDDQLDRAIDEVLAEAK